MTGLAGGAENVCGTREESTMSNSNRVALTGALLVLALLVAPIAYMMGVALAFVLTPLFLLVGIVLIMVMIAVP